MSNARRLVKVLGELVMSILSILLFGATLVGVIMVEVAPHAGDHPDPLPFERYLGHGGSLIFMVVVCALATLGGLATAISALRRLRSGSYLVDPKQPTYEDFM